MKRRTVDALFGLGLILALVGGALLFDSLRGVADRATTTAEETAAIGEKNSELVCAIGTLLRRGRIEQRAEEGLREFRRRVRAIRMFVAKLNELENCEAAKPRSIRLRPKDRKRLRGDRKQQRQRRQGGGAQQSPQATQQPSPPSGGPPAPSGPGKSNPPNFPGHVCQKAPKNPHC